MTLLAKLSSVLSDPLTDFVLIVYHLLTVSVFYSVSCREKLCWSLCSCGAFKLYMHKVSKQCRIAKTLGDQVKMNCGDFLRFKGCHH